MKSKFSIERIALLWNFYSPAIRRQWLIVGAALIVSYCLCLGGVLYIRKAVMLEAVPTPGFLIYALGANIMSTCLYCGPLIFGFCRPRRVATTLPATWQEKAFFTLAYVLVAYPVFEGIVWYSCIGLASIFTADAAMTSWAFIDAMGGIPVRLESLVPLAQWFNVVGVVSISLISTFCIACTRKARLAMGIVAILGTLFVNFIIGIALGIAGLVRSGLMEETAPVSPSEFSNTAFDRFLAMMESGLYVYALALTVAAVVLAVLIVLKIKNRQD